MAAVVVDKGKPEPIVNALLLDDILFDDWDLSPSLCRQDGEFTCHVRILPSGENVDLTTRFSLAGGFSMIAAGILFARAGPLHVAGSMPKPVFRLFLIQVSSYLVCKRFYYKSIGHPHRTLYDHHLDLRLSPPGETGLALAQSSSRVDRSK